MLEALHEFIKPIGDAAGPYANIISILMTGSIIATIARFLHRRRMSAKQADIESLQGEVAGLKVRVETRERERDAAQAQVATLKAKLPESALAAADTEEKAERFEAAANGLETWLAERREPLGQIASRVGDFYLSLSGDHISAARSAERFTRLALLLDPQNQDYASHAMEAALLRAEMEQSLDRPSIDDFDAISAYTAGSGESAAALAVALVQRAGALIDSGKWCAALPVARRAVRVAAKRLDGDDPHRLWANYMLGRAFHFNSQDAAAEILSRETLTVAERNKPKDARLIDEGLFLLVATLFNNGKFEEAAEQADQLWENRRKSRASDKVSVALARGWHAMALAKLGKLDAVASHIEAIEHVLGERTRPETEAVCDLRGQLMELMALLPGNAERLIEIGEQQLGFQKQILGELHPNTLHTACKIADACYAIGRHEEAYALALPAFQSLEQDIGRHHRTFVAEGIVAHALYGLNRLDEAEAHAQHALEGLLELRHVGANSLIAQAQQLLSMIRQKRALKPLHFDTSPEAAPSVSGYPNASRPNLIQARLQDTGPFVAWTASVSAGSGRN